MWRPLWETLLPAVGTAERRRPLLRLWDGAALFFIGPLVFFTGAPEDLLALAAAWKRLLRL